MVARIIFIAKDVTKSAVIDLLTGEIIGGSTGGLTVNEARELLRPLLEKFLQPSASA